MKIKVLGSGCQTCQKLHELVKTIVAEVNETDVVEYITGDKCIQEILKTGAMSSPVLVVDGKVVMVGFNSNKDKVKEKIYGHI